MAESLLRDNTKIINYTGLPIIGLELSTFGFLKSLKKGLKCCELFASCMNSVHVYLSTGPCRS